ncbi:polysaccharide pyruvyl transferase family protein [Isoptericola sp. NPDC055881]
MALLGQFGIGNLGNEASLDAVLGYLGDEAAVTIVTERPELVAAARELPARALTDPRARRGGWRGAVAKVRDVGWAWRTVGAVDAVVVPGTGVLEGASVKATAIPLTLAVHASCARLRGRPLHALSIGVDEGGGRLTRLLFRVFLRCASTLTVRDQGSAAHVASIAGSRPEVVPDLVLGTPVVADVRPVDPARRTVGFGVIDTNGVGTVEAAWERGAHLDRSVRIVRGLVQAGADVRIVGGAAQDDAIAGEIARTVADPRVVAVRADDMAELDRRLAGCAVLVAARYHNLVAAVRASVPAVSIGYASKQTWLMEAVGAEDRAHDVAHVDPDAVVRQVVRLLDDDGERARARTASQAWVEQAQDLVDAQASRLRRALGLSPATARVGADA